MPISQTARATHEELFPGHVSTLARTDPELVEVFDNFAFDEVLSHADLAPRTRLMTQLAALIAVGAVREYRVMLGAALTIGVTRSRRRRSSTRLCRTWAWVGCSTSCTPPTTY